jgi:protocatechuate 3,4-dioxygenase beta subunit
MEQTRANFIKSLLIGATSVPVFVQACKKDAVSSTTTSSSSDSTGVSTGSSSTCVVSPTETEGPFPYPGGELKNLLERSDITESQTGIPATFTFTVVNTNSSCAIVSGARVDIWHCNKDGYYSGYDNQNGGVSGLATDYAGQTFFRGYQLTDSNGQAKFSSIYPGWYTGRATHVHIEVYVNNVLKKTSQVAFNESISNTVHVTSLYKAHGVNPISDSSDNVFGDSATDLAIEMLAITGDTTNGYAATFTIGIAF